MQQNLWESIFVHNHSYRGLFKIIKVISQFVLTAFILGCVLLPALQFECARRAAQKAASNYKNELNTALPVRQRDLFGSKHCSPVGMVWRSGTWPLMPEHTSRLLQGFRDLAAFMLRSGRSLRSYRNLASQRRPNGRLYLVVRVFRCGGGFSNSKRELAKCPL